jgi:hypothetical protein
MKLTTVIAIFLAFIFNNAVFAETWVHGKARGQTAEAACAKAEIKARGKMDARLAKKGKVLDHAQVQNCECAHNYDDEKQKYMFRCQLNLAYKALPLPAFKVVDPAGNEMLDSVETDSDDKTLN